VLRVWVDDWQMQCCGQPIEVGAKVSWTLKPADDLDFAAAVLGQELAQSLTHAEEHHGGLPDGAPVTVGTVTAIKAVRCRYDRAPGGDDKTLYPVEGTVDLREVSRADGWERDEPDLRFVCYLVDVDED